MLQYSATHRTNNMTDLVTQAGATAYLLVYSGAAPANCAAAATGTLLASLPCSATFGTVTTGVLTANAITSAAAAASGTAGYWRLCTSSAGTTVVAQGNVYQTSTAVTSAVSTAVPTLAFASAPAVVNGQTVTGTGVPAGTYVVSGGGTTTLTLNNQVTVASGATITFGGDISFNSAVFSAGQTVSVTSMILTATGA